MARVTAIMLRDAARAAMLDAGGRGFVRFLPPGGALLATDAVRRCADEAARAALEAALADAGFVCCERGGLLLLTPKDEVLTRIEYDAPVQIDWSSTLHPVMALGARWHKREKQALTEDGRQLILEALRLSWQPVRQAQDGIEALRAQGAVMLRTSESSGMHEAGAVLLGWCDQWIEVTDGRICR